MQPGTGAEVGSGCPTAPPVSCVLDDGSGASYSTVSIACTVPPGVGAPWNVSIRGYWISLGPRVGYAAPTIVAVSPQLLPITGGRITVMGSNFGPSQCAFAGPSRVDLALAQPPVAPLALTFNASMGGWSPSAALVQSSVPCSVTQWTSDSIECEAPPGLDGSTTLRVTVGGQQLVGTGLVAYQAPAVLSFTTTGSVGTTGGALLSIVGTGLPDPPWPVAVAVGAQPCALVPGSRTSTGVTCVVPRGWGRQAIVVHTPLQASTQEVLLQYDAPEIVDVGSPSGRPIEGGFLIEVHGRVRSTRRAIALHDSTILRPTAT